MWSILRCHSRESWVLSPCLGVSAAQTNFSACDLSTKTQVPWRGHHTEPLNCEARKTGSLGPAVFREWGLGWSLVHLRPGEGGVGRSIRPDYSLPTWWQDTWLFSSAPMSLLPARLSAWPTQTGNVTSLNTGWGRDQQYHLHFADKRAQTFSDKSKTY